MPQKNEELLPPPGKYSVDVPTENNLGISHVDSSFVYSWDGYKLELMIEAVRYFRKNESKSTGFHVESSQNAAKSALSELRKLHAKYAVGAKSLLSCPWLWSCVSLMTLRSRKIPCFEGTCNCLTTTWRRRTYTGRRKPKKITTNFQVGLVCLSKKWSALEKMQRRCYGTKSRKLRYLNAGQSGESGKWNLHIL